MADGLMPPLALVLAIAVAMVMVIDFNLDRTSTRKGNSGGWLSEQFYGTISDVHSFHLCVV